MNDPNDPDYRKLVWQDLQMTVDPDLLPHPPRDADQQAWEKFTAQKEAAISAAIERRRIGMIQRANIHRMRTGSSEPLVDPFGSTDGAA
jgi:hypothetical protein